VKKDGVVGGEVGSFGIPVSSRRCSPNFPPTSTRRTPGGGTRGAGLVQRSLTNRKQTALGSPRVAYRGFSLTRQLKTFFSSKKLQKNGFDLRKELNTFERAQQFLTFASEAGTTGFNLQDNVL
jgi:hypothetical protein